MPSAITSTSGNSKKSEPVDKMKSVASSKSSKEQDMKSDDTLDPDALVDEETKLLNLDPVLDPVAKRPFRLPPSTHAAPLLKTREQNRPTQAAIPGVKKLHKSALTGPNGMTYMPASSNWSVRCHPACGARPRLYLFPAKVTNVYNDCVQLTREQRAPDTAFSRLKCDVSGGALQDYLSQVTAGGNMGMRNNTPLFIASDGALADQAFGITGRISPDEGKRIEGAVKGNCIPVLREMECQLNLVANGVPAETLEKFCFTLLCVFMEVALVSVISLLLKFVPDASFFCGFFMMFMFLHALLNGCECMQRSAVTEMRTRYRRWANAFGLLAAELERLREENVAEPHKGWEIQELEALTQAGLLTKINPTVKELMAKNTVIKPKMTAAAANKASTRSAAISAYQPGPAFSGNKDSSVLSTRKTGTTTVYADSEPASDQSRATKKSVVTIKSGSASKLSDDSSTIYV